MLVFNKTLSKNQKSIIRLSSLGGMLEFFDFTVYALFAGYFASQFFPANNPLLSLLATYSVFVLGYMIRPMGGVIFSYVGDTLGRKKVLIITMSIMGISTFGIGLLPTYDQIGVLAPLLMIGLRLFQGIAFGGELPSMIVYLSETIPHKRSLGIGSAFAGTVFGLVIAMCVNFSITHMLSKEAIISYGWRIPFFLGGVLCIIAYKARRKLQESEVFLKEKSSTKHSILHLFRNHFQEVLTGIGLVSIVATGILLLIIFMPTYLYNIVKLSPDETGNIVLITAFVCVVFIYLSGLIAEKINLYRFTVCSLFLVIVSASLCYYLISIQQYLYLGFISFAIVEGALITLPIVYLSYIFPVSVRMSGIALTYNISFILFGGLTPVFVTAIINKTGFIYFTPLMFIFISAAITFWAVNQAEKHIKHSA